MAEKEIKHEFLIFEGMTVKSAFVTADENVTLDFELWSRDS
jgi:hypothetical protein